MRGVEDETVTHLFAECSYFTELWEDIQNTLASKLNLPNVSPQNVILGITDCQSSFVTINHHLLLFKLYVYMCGMEVKLISFSLNVFFAEYHKHGKEDSN